MRCSRARRWTPFALNERLSREVGVTGVPVPALCQAGSATAETMASVVRYSFCKSADDVAEAAARLRTYARTVARTAAGLNDGARGALHLGLRYRAVQMGSSAAPIAEFSCLRP